MKIIYYDGSILTGYTIDFSGNTVIVDDIYYVDIQDIERIED